MPVAPGSQENLSNNPHGVNAAAANEAESPSATKPDLIVEIEIKSK